MNKDPYWRKIELSLAGKIDRDLFERYAVEAVRREIPSAVPVSGGSDDGVDGMTAGSGPFLVITTAKSPLANLKGSLDSYLRSCGPRRSIVLVNREDLSKKRRDNLDAAAAERGFTVVQNYDRNALVPRLYRDSAWCKDLLGLSGKPAALSALPPRPRVGPPQIVGREGVISWLSALKGDGLLIGDPGVGKTHILFGMSQRGHGLFLVSQDEAEIANGIRDQGPTNVFVDDPHATPEFLERLKVLRVETKAEFRIIATAWSGEAERQQEALGVPDQQVFWVKPLRRDDMVEVVKLAGIESPVGLVRELLDQAAGRPGVVVALVYLVLSGDVEQVALGQALRRHLRVRLERLLGKDPSALVGAFALGGDGGLEAIRVAQALNKPLDDLLVEVRLLAAGGVLRPGPSGTFVAWPPALRWALVNEYFFGPGPHLPFEEFFRCVADPQEAVSTLVGAAHCGASIPGLAELVANFAGAEGWRSFVLLGAEEANWVLGEHPQLLEEVVLECLRVIPARTLPELFAALASCASPRFNRQPWPLEAISSWIKKAAPYQREAISRRHNLAEAILQSLQTADFVEQALKCLPLVFRIGFEVVESDPGSGNTVTFRRGALLEPDVAALAEAWRSLASCLGGHVDRLPWPELLDVLGELADPASVAMGKAVRNSLIVSCKELATLLIDDLADFSAGMPAVQQRLGEAQKDLGLDMSMNPCGVFETLFPLDEHVDDWDARQSSWTENLVSLADEWASRGPAEILDGLIDVEEQATLLSKTYPRLTPQFCGELASRAESPAWWVGEVMSRGMNPDLVEPFLRQALSTGEDTEGLFLRLLATPRYQYVVVCVGLGCPSLPATVVDGLFRCIDDGYKQMVSTLIIRGEVSEGYTRRLLECEMEPLATSAAAGEWNAEPKRSVREGVRTAWEHAVAAARSETYWMVEILKSEPDLAYRWIAGRIEENPTPPSIFTEDKLARSASESLDQERLSELLGRLEDTYVHRDIARILVGDSVSLYRQLAESPGLDGLKLAPLAGNPTEKLWQEKALIGIRNGVDCGRVVHAVTGNSRSFSGSASEYWTMWRDRFAVLTDHPSEELRAVGEEGCKYLGERVATLRAREEDEEIYGR